MRSVAGPVLDQAVSRQLIEAIADAARHPRGRSDPGCTLTELASETGMCESWCAVRLKRLVLQGRVKVGYRIGADVLGRSRRTPVYRIEEGSDGRT